MGIQMKPFLDVEANRIQYHKFDNVNTVHRSSLLVPRFEHTKTNISFLNHFLLKRNNRNITLKITPINTHGHSKDAISLAINEPKVYSLNLEELFSDYNDIIEYIVEFYSDVNLFIPFPAVMINHIGYDFVNSVHSFNRVLNDVFEDDKINMHQVHESSIDVLSNKEYDTFFNFATGPFTVTEAISILNSQNIEKKIIPSEIKRFSNKNYFLSELFNCELSDGTVLKILQPKQPLFYGRLLAGIMNKSTKAFSANHSYYDSSSTEEYFQNDTSYRTYPYFANSLNRITMYPIMSPSELNIHIELYEATKKFISHPLVIVSPSNTSISFDINSLVQESGFKKVSLFKVVAQSKNGKIPTRVNHQLIYGPLNSTSKLRSSINVSLLNEEIYTE